MAYKPKKRKTLEQSMEVLRGSSGEPLVREEHYRLDLIKALNWYSLNCEDKDLLKYAMYYAKHNNFADCAYALGKADFLEYKAIGSIGRLVARDQYVCPKDLERIHSRLQTLKHKYKKAPPVKAVVTQQGPVLSIQERILESARKHAGEIDEQIDSFITEKSSSFSAKSYLLSNAISGAVAKRIGEMYRALAAELREAVAGKDKDLKEAYSHFSAAQLKKFAAFVQQIVDDCNQQVVTAKVQRKPRVRKAKPASVVAAKIKPMREFAELKLKSIEPAKIIGADELWVYTPETRKLTVFYGAHNGQLSVSGMSVANYDVEKSETKTLRKPEEFFKGLSSMGKRAMANAWKSVKAKTSKPRARINDGMILLAAN